MGWIKRVVWAMALMVTVSISGSEAWEVKPAVDTPETTITANLRGPTDDDMIKVVSGILERAQAKDSKINTVKFNIVSPGGPIFSIIELTQMIRNASDAGLIVEMHAHTLCASGCTFVLASATPGHRTIAPMTMFLVHPPQRGGFFGAPSCIEHPEKATTVDEKISAIMLEMMRDLYMRFTGQDQKTVEGWLTCGKETVGTGQSAVDMKIADKVS